MVFQIFQKGQEAYKKDHLQDFLKAYGRKCQLFFHIEADACCESLFVC